MEPILPNVLQKKFISLSKSAPTKVRTGKSFSVFKRTAYISPLRLNIKNYERHLLAAFNPGATIANNKLHIFPRLVFGYNWYTSSIGHFTVNIEEAISKVKATSFSTEIIKYPTETWEHGAGSIGGCEDARIANIGGKNVMAYTAVAKGKDGILPLQAYATMDSKFQPKVLNYFKINHNGANYITSSWKDSAFLDTNSANVLTRPAFKYGSTTAEVCWSAKMDFDTGEIPSESFEPLLRAEEFEEKVGWSTNAVKLGNKDFLVGYHGVGSDFVYRNGIAVVNSEGKLLGATDYLLSPSKSIEEYYGDVPHVMFGCGLVRYKEYLIWVGGLSDYAIGIYAAKSEDIIEKIKWIN